jgi:hypothetical protein
LLQWIEAFKIQLSKIHELQDNNLRNTKQPQQQEKFLLQNDKNKQHLEYSQTYKELQRRIGLMQLEDLIILD